jgi:hypothetical protein
MNHMRCRLTNHQQGGKRAAPSEIECVMFEGSRARTQIHEEKKESASILVFFLYSKTISLFFIFIFIEIIIYMIPCCIVLSNLPHKHEPRFLRKKNKKY